ncbi:hypothetical protein BRC91_06680 [Halobacteriales archaeon QS_4_62_28]|nr:MAG: hypothetical protein BRC91_06680 [Halobacteriales archaeon QS_4_62_28]
MIPNRTGWRIALFVLGVVAVLVASGPTVAVPDGQTTAGTVGTAAVDTTGCADGDDGVVFATDSGLTVTHDGRFLLLDPYTNETTLSFPNVTVSATGNASVQIASATDRRLCVTAVAPTDASIVLTPATGPRIVVEDSLDTLAYGAIDYDRTADGVDLAYSAPDSSRLVLSASEGAAGRVVRAIDTRTGTQVASGEVTETGTVALSLPAGNRTVDVRVAPNATPTRSPADDDMDEVTIEAETTTDRRDGGDTSGADSQSGAENGTGSTLGGLPPWASAVVDHHPFPQTQHVGGLLPLAVLLWALALWLLLAHEGAE